MKSIIIFGGSGYVGKNLIRSFAKKGYKIIVPYQTQINEANLRLLGSIGQITPFHFTSLKNPRLLSMINSSEVCINLKTSWESKESLLNNSIFKFNSELIKAFKDSSSIKKFIFFSGLGAEKGLTLRNEIIAKTEKLITTELESSIIIRPSVILGNGDKFLSSLLPLFKISFFIPLFGNGSTKFQPVLIEDVVKFISTLIEECVDFNWLTLPIQYQGKDNLDEVKIAKMELGSPDESGRRKPEIKKNSEEILKADLVIEALGFEPEDLPTMFDEPSLNITKWGTIKVNYKNLMTSLDGVFAAGDIVRGASLVVWGIKDGRDVANHIHHYLHNSTQENNRVVNE